VTPAAGCHTGCPSTGACCAPLPLLSSMCGSVWGMCWLRLVCMAPGLHGSQPMPTSFHRAALPASCGVPAPAYQHTPVALLSNPHTPSRAPSLSLVPTPPGCSVQVPGAVYMMHVPVCMPGWLLSLRWSLADAARVVAVLPQQQQQQVAAAASQRPPASTAAAGRHAVAAMHPGGVLACLLCCVVSLLWVPVAVWALVRHAYLWAALSRVGPQLWACVGTCQKVYTKRFGSS
jgi:hypothetical protein